MRGCGVLSGWHSMRVLCPSQFRLNQIHSMKIHNHNQHHREHNIHQICRWRTIERKRNQKKKNGTQKQQFSLWLCTTLHLFGLYKLATRINPTKWAIECETETERMAARTKKKAQRPLKRVYERLDEWIASKGVAPFDRERSRYISQRHTCRKIHASKYFRRRRWQRCCSSFSLFPFLRSLRLLLLLLHPLLERVWSFNNIVSDI